MFATTCPTEEIHLLTLSAAKFSVLASLCCTSQDRLWSYQSGMSLVLWGSRRYLTRIHRHFSDFPFYFSHYAFGSYSLSFEARASLPMLPKPPGHTDPCAKGLLGLLRMNLKLPKFVALFQKKCSWKNAYCLTSEIWYILHLTDS